MNFHCRDHCFQKFVCIKFQNVEADDIVAQRVQDAERIHELSKYKIRKMNGNQN